MKSPASGTAAGRSTSCTHVGDQLALDLGPGCGTIAVVRTIDLNADVGEMAPDLDEAIIEVVTSVNIACGGHAGDDQSMTRVATLAASQRVRIGAHPSYLDRDGFGRTRQDVDPTVLSAQVRDQILRLASCSRAPVEYVKPHGALYHAGATDPFVAEAIVAAVVDASQQLGNRLALMGQPGSLFLKLAGREGLTAITEGFADRAYRGDGELVPRHEPGAVLTQGDAVIDQVVALARGEVVTADGRLIAMRAESVCLHSDTVGAAELAHRIRTHLDATGVRVQAGP